MLHSSHRWLTFAVLLVLPRPSEAQATKPLSEVVVESNRLERRSKRDPTASSSVLRREDFSQPGNSMASAVARASGAQIQRSGSSAEPATLSLRGATSAQLPVYLGPIALNDELTGSSDLSLLPLFFIERIEIYRGHAPLFADRLGMGGALVLEPRLPKGTGWYGGVTLGSFGATSLYAGASAGNAQAGSLVGLQRTTAANNYAYLDNRGTVTDATDDRRVLRLNTDSETLEIWNTGHYRPSPKTRLRWLMHGLEREQGVTGLSVIPASRARALARRELAALTVTTACGNLENCSVEAQTSWLRTNSSLEDPALELGYGATRLDSAATRVSQRLRLNHEVFSGLSLGWLLGGDIGVLEVAQREDAGARAQRHSGLLGLNSVVRASESLTLLALGRWAFDRTDADGGARKSADLASARLGLRYAISEALTVVANVGHYGRQPSLAELYGTSATLRGNSDLRPEQGYSEDVGLVWDWSGGPFRTHGEAIGYHQATTDLVAWRRSTFGQVRPYNVGQARLLGAEFSTAVGVADAMRLEAGASLLDPRDTTPDRIYNNSILPYRSRLTGSLRFDAYLPKRITVPGIRSAGLGATWLHRSSRYTAPAGNAVLASSTTLDLDARLLLSLLPLTLRANVTNVLGRQNYDLLGMPLPGRSYFFGAEIHWEVSP